MTLRELVIRAAANVTQTETPKDANSIIYDLISFCDIWSDVIDSNLEDLDIKKVPI